MGLLAFQTLPTVLQLQGLGSPFWGNPLKQCEWEFWRSSLIIVHNDPCLLIRLRVVKTCWVLSSHTFCNSVDWDCLDSYIFFGYGQGYRFTMVTKKVIHWTNLTCVVSDFPEKSSAHPGGSEGFPNLSGIGTPKFFFRKWRAELHGFPLMMFFCVSATPLQLCHSSLQLHSCCYLLFVTRYRNQSLNVFMSISIFCTDQDVCWADLNLAFSIYSHPDVFPLSCLLSILKVYSLILGTRHDHSRKFKICCRVVLHLLSSWVLFEFGDLLGPFWCNNQGLSPKR